MSLVVAFVLFGCRSTNPLSPSATGEWRGSYRVVNCSSVGGDFRHCGVQHTLSPFSVHLVLHADHRGGVGGTATIQSAYVSAAVIPVAGRIDGDMLTLGGDATFPSRGGIYVTDRVRLYDWQTRLDESGAMSGTFRQETFGYYACQEVRYTSILEGEVSTLVRE
jgi:hypothetical protein